MKYLSVSNIHIQSKDILKLVLNSIGQRKLSSVHTVKQGEASAGSKVG